MMPEGQPLFDRPTPADRADMERTVDEILTRKADEIAPVTADDIARMTAAIASQHDRKASASYGDAVAESTARRVHHDHQAAVGDVPADVEIDDTETADR